MWLDETVIGLNLCPFAKSVSDAKRIEYFVSNVDSDLELIAELEQKLNELAEDDSIETCLLIHPNVLVDFVDYNQFLDNADSLLEVMKLEGVIQIASFHPNYQFAGTTEKSPENFTNRSPFPMLHLLRESSVQAAIETYPNINDVPKTNIERMNSLGYEALTSKLTHLQNYSKSPAEIK